ncbi:PREDICTED: UDP-N-acetylglucosamine transferase subunit ALG13 homolog [Priapulus caudatus]|uniref:UDP-N-acetylglucosamine transferase subunit ALG13 n=1 Tax=Priapulus caudatus TaxID=37621 RepID=A0ABM1DWH7_PRICU|nr:PREDICTED: UDP-N-acetylglucosamine transferase subunit ALG13 homolog [Priapulus caudatus]
MAASSSKSKSVFVTVGTTCFDRLIMTVITPDFCKVLHSIGYDKVVLQAGRGIFDSDVKMVEGLQLEYYRFKNSIADDIGSADLVISHAGAGTVLETLDAGKPLIVVINEELMGNHQLELAEQLYTNGHLFYATCSTLVTTLQSMNMENLKPFPRGEPSKFATFLDKLLGFS